MNIEQETALIFTLLGASLAFFGLLSFRLVYIFWQKFKLEHYNMRHPVLVEYSSLRACNGPHDWQDVKLMVHDLKPGMYKICVECGAIMGQETKMVSNEILKQVEKSLDLLNKNKALEIETQVRVIRLLQDYADRYISENFKKEKDDPVTLERLKNLVMYTVKALNEAQDKVGAEISAQTDLNERYEKWSNKAKGNA